MTNSLERKADGDQLNPRVAIAKVGKAVYSSKAPYHPYQLYPEYPFGDKNLSAAPNPAYEGVREAFRLYGLDEERFGTSNWNPLGEVIHPGDRVVIKPNFVHHQNAAGHGPEPVVTHPSVLRAIADYAFIALKGEGSLVIADAPQADCDFAALSEWAQLDAITAFYGERGLHLDVIDMRKLRLVLGQRSYALSNDRVHQDGDPLGYTKVDLSKRSLLESLPNIERLYGSDYDRSTTVAHHRDGHHEYLVGRTILSADVVISVPKMKVHKKVGVTLNIKNLVGINGDKNYLPHFRIGSPAQGGDAYPNSMDARGKRVIATRQWLTDRLLAKNSRLGDNLYRFVYWAYRTIRDRLGIEVDKPVEAGNWHGNDTCWRMAVDLNAILFFADEDGGIHDTPRRRVFSVVDGIIGGEKDGPLSPSPAPSGVIAVGRHPYAVDMAVTRLMGFDHKKVPQLAHVQSAANGDTFASLFRLAHLDDLEIRSNELEIASMMGHTRAVNRPYEPHPGWVGHIEI